MREPVRDSVKRIVSQYQFEDPVRDCGAGWEANFSEPLFSYDVSLFEEPDGGKSYAGFDEAGIGTGPSEYRANPRAYL